MKILSVVVAGIALASNVASAPASSSPLASCSSVASCFTSKGKKYFGTFGLTSSSLKAFNQITGDMTWATTESTQNNFNFGGGNVLVNYAQTNGWLVRGSTLVWHSQLPSWVSSITNTSTLTTVIQNHISKLGGQWKGKIYAWDVCSEILREDGEYRSSVFYNVLGSNFVPIAFNAAKAADPGAKLYISDYGLDSASNAKTFSLSFQVQLFRASGVPIDGIGSETHIRPIDAGNVQGALEVLAATGVSEVAITQLDILGGLPSDWVTVVKACILVPSCVGITVADSSSLFNGNTPNAAYKAILSMLQQA